MGWDTFSFIPCSVCTYWAQPADYLSAVEGNLIAAIQNEDWPTVNAFLNGFAAVSEECQVRESTYSGCIAAVDPLEHDNQRLLDVKTMRSVAMQNSMNAQQQILQLVSNVLKSVHEDALAAVRDLW